ncbi:hypothetical protein DACRYDRAFT_111205 [Dacryopinax primogenitus]|uniref:Ubiquitin-like domain-containing protein n=1 Tax=Dacryopinax primogenitus (strain DJM 731) TaxID=1858805 RepID=M5FP57_DACPD|nr:uncharacterized protein DACRYDRAFT_111205 [Dacryopinax primogenitus]EJT98235.1 hypothetical protein DACRYDRAFT_111205 [Dacryopinax primogenitus]
MPLARQPDSDDDNSEKPCGEEGGGQLVPQTSQMITSSSEGLNEVQQQKTDNEPLPSSNTEAKRKVRLTLMMDDGRSMQMILSRTLPCSKIFRAVEKKFNIQRGILRYRYEDRPVGEADTPDSLGMDDEDHIDANIEQVYAANQGHVNAQVASCGGGLIIPPSFRASSHRQSISSFQQVMPSYEEEEEIDEQQQEERPSESQAKKKLRLTIQCQGQECQVDVSATTQFGKVFEAAYKRFNKKKGTLRFLYEGGRIRDSDTPKMLEMESGDVIDAELEQLGGGPW